MDTGLAILIGSCIIFAGMIASAIMNYAARKK